MQSAPRDGAPARNFSFSTGTNSIDRHSGSARRVTRPLPCAASETELGQDLLGMLAELRRRPAERARRAVEARHDLVHGHRAEVGVLQFGQRAAAEHIGMGHQVGHRDDRRHRHAGRAEGGEIVGEALLADMGVDDGVEFVAMGDAIVIGAEAGIGLEVRPPDGVEDALGHRLHRAGHGEVAAVGADIDVARRGMRRLVARAHGDRAGRRGA